MNPRLLFPLMIVATALLLFWAGCLWENGNPTPTLLSPKNLPQRPISSHSATTLPTPKAAPSPTVATTQDSASTPPANPSDSWLANLFKDGAPKVTVAQLKGYLRENGRSAESLLTAFRLTGETSLLREAAQNFPNDPRVQFELAMKSTEPKERVAALKAFAAAEPSNALGSYLAANLALASGDTTEGLKLLTEASERTGINDYRLANAQADEEAYVAAGLSPLQAKAAAMMGASLSHLSELRDLSSEMSSLRERYLQGGDANSAQIVTDMDIALGRQIQDHAGNTAFAELVGQSIERQALKQLDPATVLNDTGLTVSQRLDQLATRKDLVAKTIQGFDLTTAAVNPQLLGQYLDRQKALGEVAARQWLRSQLELPKP